MAEQFFSYQRLFDFTQAVFRAIGCPEADAAIATRTLLSADLRGVDSHGVARLSGYVRLWEAKRVNATPQLRVVHETPSTAVVDGDSGLGLVVAPFAMEIAIKKAKEVGTGWVSVQNSNHFGIAGYHAMMALEHDMIGIAMTNASPLVAPTFSTDKMLGTNPICVAAPAGRQPAFVADLATTTAANGKLEILQRKKQPTPSGWIQDKDGNPSTDPHALKSGGALLPLGGDREHGHHADLEPCPRLLPEACADQQISFSQHQGHDHQHQDAVGDPDERPDLRRGRDIGRPGHNEERAGGHQHRGEDDDQADEPDGPSPGDTHQPALRPRRDREPGRAPDRPARSAARRRCRRSDPSLR